MPILRVSAKNAERKEADGTLELHVVEHSAARANRQVEIADFFALGVKQKNSDDRVTIVRVVMEF